MYFRQGASCDSDASSVSAECGFRLLKENPLEVTEKERASAVSDDDLLNLHITKRHRAMGSIRLLGMLFLRGLLKASTLRNVFCQLLSNTESGKGPHEYMLECFVELLSTVGKCCRFLSRSVRRLLRFKNFASIAMLMLS